MARCQLELSFKYSRMAACGRKRTLDLVDFSVSERPVSGKADIQGTAQNFHKIDQLGTSALPLRSQWVDATLA
jgi:hypothetical protein